ncbi:MAG: NDP-hexose 2,3-dehydratase family protein [Pseudohongiella sp.]|nr:NDP-hexose 2,3-dehydratase family protein [Pseudohongiella sp.]
MEKTQNTALMFLKSALSKEGSFISVQDVLGWLKEQNERVVVNINKTKFSELENWHYDEKNGNLRHVSGRFFSIDGIDVETNWGSVSNWQQPIINQPEVGYLGFITQEKNGILHFLEQAKIEPGNINKVQLSPTLQATRSNYTQVHKGKQPDYLEYFQRVKPSEVLLDQLQSEQGARFLRKRNRNIIITVHGDIEIKPNFVWLTLGQIKRLMQFDDVVNMDSRTVISGISFGNFDSLSVNVFACLQSLEESSPIKSKMLTSALSSDTGITKIDEVISYLTHYKSTYDLKVTKVPLKQLDKWIFSDEKIYHEDSKFFNVLPIQVEISNREVVKWCQPMIQPAQMGICAFIVKLIDNVVHFAVQVKLECGNHDIVELAPTVQCLTGNFRDSKKGQVPFLDYVIGISPEQIIYDSLQSEEGGRFYHEQNRNMIVVVGDDIPIELPEKFIWMTLNQLYVFLKFNNYLNIQARSLLAAVSFV